jgi:hypothetical protein
MAIIILYVLVVGLLILVAVQKAEMTDLEERYKLFSERIGEQYKLYAEERDARQRLSSNVDQYRNNMDHLMNVLMVLLAELGYKIALDNSPHPPIKLIKLKKPAK